MRRSIGLRSLPVLARPDAIRRDCQSRLQSRRLHEQPFEISGGAFALRRLRDGDVVAALFRAIGPLAELAAAVGDEADAVIAGWVGAFHDTLLRYSLVSEPWTYWSDNRARRRFKRVGVNAIGINT